MNRQPSDRVVSPEIGSPIELQRSSWKSKYEQICATHVTNGESEVENKKPSGEEEGEEGQVLEMQKPNALIGLSGYLSSSEESDFEDTELSSEVKAFLKEVDAIDSVYKAGNKTADPSKKSAPTIGWQECYDQSTGYTYYWNVDSNEVTWSMPEAYKKHLENTKHWQEFQAQAEVAAALQKVRQQQQKQQLQQQQALLKQQALDQLNQIKQAEALKTAKKEKAKAKKMRKQNSSKQSDSEDEKIELITSYGPDSGDESSTDPETKVEDKPPPVKKKKIVKTPKDPVKDAPSVVMGPQLPPAILKRQRIHSVVLAKNRLVPYQLDSDAGASPMPAPPPPPSFNSTDLRRFKSVDASGGRGGVTAWKNHGKEDEDVTKILDRLRSQSQVLKELGGELPAEVKSTLTTDKSSKELVKSKGTDLSNGPSRETDLKSSAKSVESTTCEPTSSSSKRKQKIELIYKKNHDVQLLDSGKDDTRGLGFSSAKGNCSEQTQLEEQVHQQQNKRAKGDKIMFVKAEILRLSEDDNKGCKESSVQESSENVDIKDLSSLLLDKMKFLSVEKEPVSPVQIWTIQLETLLTAWEAQQLTSTHITAWLQTTSAELERLEAAGAPEGWLCQWHRSKKCYSYKNLQTSEVAWEYPQSAAASDNHQQIQTGPNRGEEDMEVCTTPPPPPSPPRISPPSPPPPPLASPPLSRSPQKKRNGSSPLTEATLPPLPPMPPPAPQEPPPPPPDDPPPPLPLHQSEPLPPGVDPPEPVPPIPIQPMAPHPEFSLHMQIPAMHTPVCVIPQIHYPLAYPAVPVAPAPLAAALPQTRPKDNQHDLSSELDIFYNDIAQLEPAAPAPLPQPLSEAVSTPPPPLSSPPRDPSPPSLPPPTLQPVHGTTATTIASAGKSSAVVDEILPTGPCADNALKKKKKTKLAPGLALKKKGVSSLVAKWQQVQEDVRRDLKNIED